MRIPTRVMKGQEECSMQKIRPTQRAPDWWDSARFQAVFVA